jgi:phosphatidyl-myo-inositol alpha-mannosyltransferase
MKKIIISSYDSIKNPFYGGGGAMINYEIAKRLSHKYEFTVLCGAYPGSSDYVTDGILYKHIGLKLSQPLLAQVLFSFIIPFYALVEKYDVWIENFVPPHSTNFIPWFTRKPVIGLAMMLDAQKFSEKYKLPFYPIEQFGIKQYKYFITLTESLKKHIQLVNRLAIIKVIPGGISSDLFHQKIHDRNFALFIGRIDVFQKGLDILLESWSLLNISMPLVIAGSGTIQEERKLKQLIIKYNLKNNVVLKGKVSGKEKTDLLTNCTLLLCPSRFETFGISALEGFACGKAVITFDIDGFSWIPAELSIKSHGINAKSYANAIRKVVSSKELRKNIQEFGPRLAKEYTWDNLSTKYTDFIEDIFNKHL